MLTTFRRCAPFVEPNRRWVWGLLLVLALAASALEIVSALAVYVLLTIMSRPNDAISVPLLGDLSVRFPGVSRDELVVWVAAGIAAFFVFRALFLVGQTYLQSRVASNAGVALSSKLLRGYLDMDYVVHLQRNSAELIRNTSASVDVVSQTLFVSFLSVMAEALVVLGLATVVLVAAPVQTLVVGVVMAGLTTLIIRVLNPRFKALGRTNQDATTSSWQILQQSLGGIRDLKILGREPYFSKRFDESRAVLSRIRYQQVTLSVIPRIALETIFVLVLVGLVVFVVVSVQSEDALAIVGLFGFAALRSLPATSRIISYVNSMRYSAAAIDDIYGDFEQMTSAQRAVVAAGPEREVPFEREIHIEHVGYRYPGTDQDVLHDINLTIKCGESVGIVGSTGAGKSTLVDLMLALLVPTRGRVLVDGVDVHQSRRSWQRMLGVVSQTVYLADDTLRANIAFGIEAADVDEERVGSALAIAQLGPLVADLPLGLETVVGERGVRLSGGERQRVAIARALYRDPAVLVFDEGTSSLDNVTEALLVDAVERLRGQKTIVTIAHRLSTVRKCDWIVLLDAGRVAAVGSYDELAAGSEVFQRMASPHQAPG